MQRVGRAVEGDPDGQEVLAVRAYGSAHCVPLR